MFNEIHLLNEKLNQLNLRSIISPLLIKTKKLIKKLKKLRINNRIIKF